VELILIYHKEGRKMAYDLTKLVKVSAL